MHVTHRVGPATNHEIPRSRQRPIGKQPRQPSARQLEVDQRPASECDAGACDRRADGGAERIEPDDRRLRAGRHAKQVEPGGPGLFPAAAVILLQQVVTQQVLRRVDRQQRRTAHREHDLAEQQPVALRQVAPAGAQDGEVETLPHHVRLLLDGAHLPLHRRMQRREGRQPWRQPHRGHRTIGRNGQHRSHAARALAHRLASGGELREGRFHGTQQSLAFGRDGGSRVAGAVARTRQQQGAQRRLETADLVAHRARADMQRQRGARETAVTRDGGEGTQRGQRGDAVGHRRSI